ncbi:MAG: TIGR03936 family radical SAM-associated protein [Anaerolineae bacterium]|jgi:radical SAM-linked protein
MSEDPLQRMRIVFSVGEEAKYISHLDLLRAWERILRRAEVPLAYSQGFNPHPRLVIAMPLPVGCTGAMEVVDAYLYEPLPPVALSQMLQAQMPPGLAATAAHEVDLHGPAMPSVIRHAVYRMLLEGVAYQEVAERAHDFMARDHVQVVFRHKTFDLRPLVGRLEAEEEDGHVTLQAVLVRLPSGRIGRPDVLLETLGLDAYARRIHRSYIAFDEPHV